MSMAINMPLGGLIDKSLKGEARLRMRNGCAPM